ncbi:hypothetical protein ACFTTN_36080 [Streptomyces niveus]|uniref:hypothetical protein n=1 Tax=Streptomyces niveus TaxID=193462 RepID=UPI003643056C
MSRQEFAALIVATGQEIGEGVGCTSRLVAAWEDGEVTLPRPVYRRILTTLTGRPLHALGFRAAVPPSRGQAPRNRRAVPAGGAAVTLSLLPVRAVADKAPGRIGAADVRAVDRAVTTLYAHDHDHGSAALRRDAARALHTA